MDNNKDFLVCYVCKTPYYGSALEYIAARLHKGEQILHKDTIEIVEYTWFYDGIIICTKSGKQIHVALGDEFVIYKEVPKDQYPQF